MLKEVRRIKERSKQIAMYFLMNKMNLPKHINERGYICYDTEELKTYKKTTKRGRRPKNK